MKKSQGHWNILPDSDLFMKIERLVVVLYDRTSPVSSVNEAREELFCRKNRSADRIPPTQDALLQTSSTSNLSSWSLYNKYTSTANTSLSARFWLD